MNMTAPTTNNEAKAHLHYQYFLELKMMLLIEEGKDAAGKSGFQIFHLRHEGKAPSSVNKIGLDMLPVASPAKSIMCY